MLGRLTNDVACPAKKIVKTNLTHILMPMFTKLVFAFNLLFLLTLSRDKVSVMPGELSNLIFVLSLWGPPGPLMMKNKHLCDCTCDCNSNTVSVSH